MKKNKIIIISEIIYNFFASLIESVVIFFGHLFLGRKDKILNENRFLDVFNFIFHIGPKSFWKKPTGIKIGRSIATLLHYIFHKEEKFREIKK